MDDNKIPDRVWDLYFGPGGQIPELQNKINTLFGKLDDLCRKIDKYNGLLEKQQCNEKEIADIKSRMAEQHTIRVTEEEMTLKVKEAEREAEVRTWRRVKMLATIAGVVIGFLGLLLTYAGIYVY